MRWIRAYDRDGMIERALSDADGAGISRQGVDAVPAGAHVRADRGQASLDSNIALVENNARVAAEIAVALAGEAALMGEGGILIVGDTMTDIIVMPEGPMVRGSDRRATVRSRPGGSGANQAVWLGGCGRCRLSPSRVAAADLAASSAHFRSHKVDAGARRRSGRCPRACW